MNDQSKVVLLISDTEIVNDEFLKLVQVNDKIKNHDNSESTVVKKVFVKQMSNNYKIQVFTDRP